MHLKRLIVAAIALPLFYFSITKLPPYFFLILLVVVTIVAQREFYTMYRTQSALAFMGILSGAALLVGGSLHSDFFADHLAPTIYSILLMASFMLVASARLFFTRDPASALKDIAPVVTGLLYIPNLLLTQWFLRLQGHEWILLLYGCVWASDSLAYYVGKGIGKRKLYREVSPNKTVEGALGSVVGGMLSAGLLGGLLLNEPGLPVLFLTGGLVGATTIVGDLVESMFKRDAGVKDSGALFPGHGGILDKIDGVLFAGPVLYCVTLTL